MRIYINRKPGTLICEVFVLSNPAQYQSFFTIKDGELIATQYGREEAGKDGVVKPVFTILEQELRELLEAFAVAANNEGVENPTESKLAGKLDATEKHLEDMRTLVFNKKVAPIIKSNR